MTFVISNNNRHPWHALSVTIECYRMAGGEGEGGVRRHYVPRWSAGNPGIDEGERRVRVIAHKA